jgi:hypothetical protein
MPEQKIRVAIFSYNRPDHLANCLTSLKDLWPGADVVVYDDNSKHPGMKAVFEKFGVPVVHCPGGTGRHGALYSNMQRAFQEAAESDFDFLAALQDDLQLVRPFATTVRDEYLSEFEKDLRVTQVEPRFGKIRPKKGEVNPAKQSPSHIPPYADVGIYHVGRLLHLGWSFDVAGSQIIPGESDLIKRASSLGMKMIYPFTPIAMHVPFPHLYRHRIRLPRLSRVSKKIFQYEYMSEAEIAEMDNRPKDQQAYWRNYLRVRNANRLDRWLMSGKDDQKILA